MFKRISSEDLKNWVTTISIVIGGIWILYEWRTIFPKTQSEISVSAAALRTRTIGEISVSVTQQREGTGVTTADGRTFEEVCMSDSEPNSADIIIPMRILFVLKSISPMPVRVNVTDFVLYEIYDIQPIIDEEKESVDDYEFIANHIGKGRSTPLGPDAFIGGLQWTDVEPGGDGALAILGSVKLPFSCGFGGAPLTPGEFGIGIKAKLASINKDGIIGEEVDRYFYKVCNINTDGGSNCLSSGDGIDSVDSRSTYRVIAQ